MTGSTFKHDKRNKGKKLHVQGQNGSFLKHESFGFTGKSYDIRTTEIRNADVMVISFGIHPMVTWDYDPNNVHNESNYDLFKMVRKCVELVEHAVQMNPKLLIVWVGLVPRTMGHQGMRDPCLVFQSRNLLWNQMVYHRLLKYKNVRIVDPFEVVGARPELYDQLHYGSANTRDADPRIPSRVRSHPCASPACCSPPGHCDTCVTAWCAVQARGVRRELSRAVVNLLLNAMCDPGIPYRGQVKIEDVVKASRIEYKVQYPKCPMHDCLGPMGTVGRGHDAMTLFRKTFFTSEGPGCISSQRYIGRPLRIKP